MTLGLFFFWVLISARKTSNLSSFPARRFYIFLGGRHPPLHRRGSEAKINFHFSYIFFAPLSTDHTGLSVDSIWGSLFFSLLLLFTSCRLRPFRWEFANLRSTSIAHLVVYNVCFYLFTQRHLAASLSHIPLIFFPSKYAEI